MFGYRPVNRRLIKAASSQAMSGNWLRSLLITFLSLLLPALFIGALPFRIPTGDELIAAGGDFFALFSHASPRIITSRTVASVVVTFIIYLLIFCPFTVGTHRFYLAVASGERGNFSHVFSPFTSLKMVFSSIGLSFMTAGASILWAIALIAPALFLMYLGFMIDSVFVVLLCFILYFIALFVLLLRVSIYKFAFYIFAEGKSGGAWKSFRTMQMITRGRTSELMGLRVSYFGWDFATAFFPGLNFIYIPLFSTVYAKYFLSLRNEDTTFEPDGCACS